MLYTQTCLRSVFCLSRDSATFFLYEASMHVHIQSACFNSCKPSFSRCSKIPICSCNSFCVVNNSLTFAWHFLSNDAAYEKFIISDTALNNKIETFILNCTLF